ncbi:MAG: cysteine--tRNA ligase [Candidatus Binatia bacterium]
MGLRIYNTLTGKKDEFIPLKEGEVRMYVCGVTVYDSCHVGHARYLITFDVIYRYLKFLGYEVTFARNFTDVDDKIIDRAKEEGVPVEQIVERYIQEFYQDAGALGLLTPTFEPRATKHIPEMIDLVRRLQGQGVAYNVHGDVFFSVDRFPGYGKLSRQRLEELEAGARVEVDERKKNPMDFALWKASKEGEPFWESPWGRGRPGWHIECSAMGVKYLGQPFDIHGGGQDLIFPHHENEIAQSEAAAGQPLARTWIHNGFVTVGGEKMSKSLGNIIAIRDAVQRHDAISLRHYFLTSHYRSPLDFSRKDLEEAGSAVSRIYETLDRAERSVNGKAEADPSLIEEFRQEMDDDFNTPRALALIFEEIRSLNRMLDEGKSNGLYPRLIALKTMGEILGLLQDKPKEFFRKKRERWTRSQGLLPEVIEELVRRRERARKEKQWQEADRIRTELQEKGITLEDTPGGTIWKVR